MNHDTKLAWRIAGPALMAIAGWPLAASAGVSELEARALQSELTEIGAERAGNESGQIPRWDGGLVRRAVDGAATLQYQDPYPDDQPLYTVTAANMEQYRQWLSPGQQALLQHFADSYAMPVYSSRRSAASPPEIYAATARNAVHARLSGDLDSVEGTTAGVPFPIPTHGAEVIWNHKLRYQGLDATRWNVQAAVTSGGDYTLSKLREDYSFDYHRTAFGLEPRDSNVLAYFAQLTTEPSRLAGTITLVHETINQLQAPRRAWQYNPGQRRLRRAPNVGYDNPGSASDGLRTNDQTDSFNGALDRYSWRLLGKREMLIPYNAYRVHSGALDYSELLGDQHLNQTHTRYELHRVWVVEAEVKPGTSHLYARRVFYVDEDSWQIHAVDIYDKRGSLWRIQDAHSLMAYDQPYMFQALEVIYDLQAGRYLVHAMSNQEPERAPAQFDSGYFEPANAKRLGRR